MRCPIETGQGAGILLAYSSGELTAEAAAQRAVWQELDRWEAPPVAGDFDRRLFARVESEISWWERSGLALLFRRGLTAAAAAVAICAALLVQRPAIAPVPQTAAVEAVAPERAEDTLRDMETLREFSGLMRAEPSDPQM